MSFRWRVSSVTYLTRVKLRTVEYSLSPALRVRVNKQLSNIPTAVLALMRSWNSHCALNLSHSNWKIFTSNGRLGFGFNRFIFTSRLYSKILETWKSIFSGSKLQWYIYLHIWIYILPIIEWWLKIALTNWNNPKINHRGATRVWCKHNQGPNKAVFGLIRPSLLSRRLLSRILCLY